MSSEMFLLDEPFYPHLSLSPEMLISSEISSNFFTDLLPDSSIDTLLQEISSDEHNPTTTTTSTTTTTGAAAGGGQISADEAQSLNQIAHTLFSNSPPSHQLETLTLSQQQTHMGNLPNSCGFSTGFSESSVSNSVSEVKTEEFQLGFESTSYNNNTQSYFLGSSDESLVKFIQRSYSSNSFEGKPAFFFQPQFDVLMEGQNFQGLASPEIDSGNCNQMRRVCSTGDLPEVRMNQMTQQKEGSLVEEANFKVGRYSAEERRERIDRYRAKRTQRNFNKTIKYACRKTLADNRPRIRGRFARNDETGEIRKPTYFQRYEDDDDPWVDNVQEEEEDGILGKGRRFPSNIGGTHFQYCGY